MNRFVTPRRPTGAYLDAGCVVRTPNKDPAVIDLLEMTLQTQSGIALGQQLGIDGTVRFMTGRTTFADGFMLEDERASLSGVASDTEIIFRQEGGAARNHDGALMR